MIAGRIGATNREQQELAITLELVRIEEFICSSRGFPGRPLQDRAAIAKSFVAKMIFSLF